MKIQEFENKYSDSIKALLVELQEYVVEIDKFELNILSENYAEKYFENMMTECNSKDGKIFVASEGTSIIGFVMGYVERYNPIDKIDYTCPKKGVVAELVVSKNCRSSGIGSELLSAIESYFHEIQCEYIQIDVFAYNTNALSFYHKKGYSDRMVTVFKKID